MSSLNHVTLIGNLGADPEVRTTAAGKMVATLSLATSRQWTNESGQRQEKTAWHRVILWGKLAELAQRFLSKGRQVCVQGEIEYRSWDDQQTGTKRYSTEIVASQMVFLDSHGIERAGSGAGQQGQAPMTAREIEANEALPYDADAVPF